MHKERPLPRDARSLRRAVCIIAASVVLLLAACGSDDSPGAVEPPLPESARELYAGQREITIQPGETYGIDTLDLAGDNNIAVPPCAAYIFAFSWQAIAPEGDVPLRVDGTRMGTTREIASGGSGAETTGCEFIEFVNTGDEDIVLDLRYALGDVS
jgi:hypothetical protein